MFSIIEVFANRDSKMKREKVTRMFDLFSNAEITLLVNVVLGKWKSSVPNEYTPFSKHKRST